VQGQQYEGRDDARRVTMALFKATTFTHLHTHLEHPQAQYQVDASTTAQEQLPASGDRTMQGNRETREQGGQPGTQHRAHSSLLSQQYLPRCQHTSSVQYKCCINGGC